uniref:Poly [ADP-ribose] polymerase n=1 Tax=Arcella intermedia TaxID=1963864 RepID=A0A6B2KWG6_9EUKA
MDDAPYLIKSKLGDSPLPPKDSYFSYESDFISEEQVQAAKDREIKMEQAKQKRQQMISQTQEISSKKPREVPTASTPKVRAFKTTDPNLPPFPQDFSLIYYKTLQWTDVSKNHNKYYVLEYHKGNPSGYRLASHYGRTDDLVKKPGSGQKEYRFYESEEDAENAFAGLINEKTVVKGYRVVELVFSNVGSEKLQSLGKEMHLGTLVEEKETGSEETSKLSGELQGLISLVYQEAASLLSNSIGPAKITAHGIETPLGVVTLAQVEKGEGILQKLYEYFKEGKQQQHVNEIKKLTNEFYTAIPHHIGRSRDAIASSVINSVQDFIQKEELLQLMKDLLTVTAETSHMKMSDLDMKYAALKCKIEHLKRDTQKYIEIHNYIVSSQVGDHVVDIENIYAISREQEAKNFRRDLYNIKQLFHGSRASNIVGLLSRGILMPKLVVSRGGKRTDEGLLGHGIYFGDNITTATKYAAESSQGTRFALICNVALGSSIQYHETKIGLTDTPSGYHSVHGVKGTPDVPSPFTEDEFVIYHPNQQEQAYLVEYKLGRSGSKLLELSTSAEVKRSVLPEGVTKTKFLWESTKKSLAKKNDLKRSYGTSLRNGQENVKKSWVSGILEENALKLEAKEPELNKEEPKVVENDDKKKMPPPSPVKHYHAKAKELEKLEEAKKEESTLATSKTNVFLDAFKSIRHSIGVFGFDKITKNIGVENNRIKKQEDQFRELFVKERQHYKLSDPYLNLLDVFEEPEQFVYSPEYSKNITMVLGKMRNLNPQCSVVEQEEFTRNFEEFTGGVLKGIDWDNILVAGGGVLGPLLNINEETRKKSFADSDIDIFIYGLTPEEATNKMEEIFYVIQSNTNASGEIIRSRNAVTIVGQYPIRHIQIILRIYKSPSEILMGFDIDCCCVGYDGETVWALPRAARAIANKFNMVDLSRRSLTYESRLYKYAKRGFAVAVPGLMRHLINPELYSKRPWQVNGLAKLLLFEHALTNPEGRYEAWKPKGHRLKIYKNDEFIEDRINEFQQNEGRGDSDYSNVFLPWGPQWYTAQIVKELVHRDKSHWANTKKHVVLVGLEAVLSGIPHWIKPDYEHSVVESSDPHSVEGPISWLLENPGTQLLSGSFHPINDENWYDESYLTINSKEEFTQTLNNAAFNGNNSLLRTLLRSNRNKDLSPSDIFKDSQRTPLNHACLLNHEDIFNELLSSSSIVVTDADNHSLHPIHYAAMSGNAAIVDLLLRRGESANVTTPTKWTPLHIAAYYQKKEVVKCLLDYKAKSIENHVDLLAKDNYGRTPLHLAAMGGSVEIVKMIVESEESSVNIKTNEGRLPLEEATVRGNVECSIFLTRQMKKSLSGLEVSEKPEAPLPQPIKTKDKVKKFLNAVQCATIQQIEKMLKNNPTLVSSTDEFRVNAFMLAAQRNSKDIFLYMLNKAPEIVNAKDSKGQTALHHAVRNGASAVVDAIISVIPDNKAKGPSVGKFVVDLECINEYGQTPLYYTFSLLSSFNFPQNIDKTDGLPPSWLKIHLEDIRSKLIKAGASLPDLNYLHKLPDNPPSEYFKLDTNPAFNTKKIDAQVLSKIWKEEQEAEERRKEEEARLLKLITQYQDSKPIQEEEKENKTSLKKRVRFESGTQSPTVPSSPEKVSPFVFPAPSHKPISPPNAVPYSFDSTGLTIDFNYINPANENRFKLPEVAIQPPPNVKPKTLDALEERARNFAKPQTPTSKLARLLVLLNTLHNRNLLTKAEKDALKTLSLKGDDGLVAAFGVYEVDKDETELLDTLRKICHIVYR